MTRLYTVVTLLALALMVASTHAQDLLGKVDKALGQKPAAASEVEPIELIRGAVTFVAGQKNTNLKLSFDFTVVQEEKPQQVKSDFLILLAQPEKFAIAPQGETIGPRVHSDGEHMVVIPPQGREPVRYQVSHGLAAFVGAPPSRMIGHGLGGFTLSFLNPLAVDSLLKAATNPEYLGVEKIGENDCHHARATTGELTWDIWIDAGAQPVIRRIVPNLADEDAEPDAEPTMKMEVNFTNWDFKTAPSPAAFETESKPHVMIGQKAPDVNLVTVTGQRGSLKQLIGKKVIVLDFWATWCPPCVASLPTLAAVADEYADKGVALFAVNQGEDIDTVKEFLAERELEVPVALDEKGKINQQLQVGNALPTSMIIGLDGRVQIAHQGTPGDQKVYRKQLQEELDAVLAGKDLATKAVSTWKEMADAVGAKVN